MLDDRLFWLGLASMVANVIGYHPYIKSILQGGVRPQRISWSLWSILLTVVFVNQVVNGGGYSSFFVGSTWLLVVVVFVLSIKKGVGGRSRLDVACLVAALILLVCWAITRDTRASTIIVVLIDGVGALPTVYKAYRRPETEAYLQWIMAAVGGLFAILAIEQWDYILILYPLYIILMNGAIVGAKYLGGLRSSEAHV